MTSKIKKTFRAVGLLFKRPYLLNLILDSDDEMKKQVQTRFGFPNGLPVVDLDVFTNNTSFSVFPYLFLDGGSMITDLALLRLLAQRFSPCRYFEIGTWRGESVANVAATGAECHTLCLTDQQMQALGCSNEYIAQHGILSKHLPNVKQWRDDSRTFDYTLIGKADLIFIDGDHHYEMVKSDTAKVFAHIVHENSIVVWHDYAHEPGSIRWEVLRGILEGVPADLHPFLYCVANTKTAIFSRQPLPLAKERKEHLLFQVNAGIQ